MGVLVAFAASAIYALHLARQEYVIVQAQHLLDRNRTVTPAQSARLPALLAAPDGKTVPPRLFLASALLHAQQAGAMPEGEARTALLGQARKEIAAIAGTRPHWGEVDVVAAYIASLTPDRLADTIGVYARSYRNAPYIREAAIWRVQFGIEHWGKLDEATRAHLTNEAVWLFRLQPDQRTRLVDMARGTDAYLPILMRWREVRLKDGDYLRRF